MSYEKTLTRIRKNDICMFLNIDGYMTKERFFILKNLEYKNFKISTYLLLYALF